MSDEFRAQKVARLTELLHERRELLDDEQMMCFAKGYLYGALDGLGLDQEVMIEAMYLMVAEAIGNLEVM